MPTRMKELALRAATSYPIYRLLPSGSLRTYAAFRYHDARSSRAEAAGLACRASTSEVRYLSTGVIAARAAFRTGHDDVLEELVSSLEARYPHAPAPFELRADLLAHRGEYVAALAAAERARLLEPSRGTAVAKVIRYGYDALSQDEADEVSLAALRRFPLDVSVMWAVGKCCFSGEQAERIVATWRKIVADRAELPQVVRQLAAAGARGRRADLGSELYREAITAVLENPRSVRPVAPRRLEGKGAWAAIEDVADALGRAGVPYFFAAGTVLGLVREGRPLALDGDIDVGVLDADWDAGTLREVFGKDSRFALDANPMSLKVGLTHRGGSPVDIFRYYEEDGRLWHDGVFVRWDNTPFAIEWRQVNGLSLPLPADADTYLTENYGDWRTPNPEYDVFTEAPNVHLTWPEYAQMHLLRAAFKDLTNGDRAACEAHLKSAGEHDLLRALRGGSKVRPPAPVDQAPKAASSGPVRLAAAEIIGATDADAAAGDRASAIAKLGSAIRDGRWLAESLWARLAELVTAPSDYDIVRRQWLDVPKDARNNVSIIRSVALAAAAAGDHDEAQALLSKAIIVTSRQARRPRAVLGRVGGFLPFGRRSRGNATVPSRPAPGDAADITAAYVELLDAMASRRTKDTREIASRLRATSANAWLDALGV